MDIRARILARPDLNGLRGARDLDGLAAALNAAPPLEVGSRFVNMRTLLAECDDAEAIIAALVEAAPGSPALTEMLAFLRSETGIDIGHPRAQARVDGLAVANVLSAAQAAEVKNMALLPVLVTRDEVNVALFNSDGTEKTA